MSGFIAINVLLSHRPPMSRPIPLAASILFIIAAATIRSAPDDQATLKEHLVSLEKQSWEAWKNRDGKF